MGKAPRDPGRTIRSLQTTPLDPRLLPPEADLAIPQPLVETSFRAAWWHEFSALRPNAGTRWGALRVGLSVTIPLAVVLCSDQPGWSIYAVAGSLCSVYGKRLAYRDRFKAQLVVGTWLVLGLALGTSASIVAGPGSLLAVLSMGAVSAVGPIVTRVFGWLPNPSLFFVLATGTVASLQHAWEDVGKGAVAAAAGMSLAIAIGQFGRLFPRAQVEKTLAAERTPLRRVISSRGTRMQALQHAAGPSASGALVLLLHLDQPHLAAVTATVPLAGTTLPVQLARGVQRLVGTLVGGLLALGLIAAHPPMWMLLAAVAGFQVLAELFVTRNYGLAVVCITPLALVLVHLAAPAPAEVLFGDRLAKTLLGLIVATAVLMGTRFFRRRLKRTRSVSEGRRFL